MTNHCDRLRCPLCEGQGEIRRSQLMEFFSDPELKNKLDSYLAAVMPLEQKPELVAATVREKRDFQKDVHNWNPQVPMWNRSPKE
jgi:hypothetical protein